MNYITRGFLWNLYELEKDEPRKHTRILSINLRKKLDRRSVLNQRDMLNRKHQKNRRRCSTGMLRVKIFKND